MTRTARLVVVLVLNLALVGALLAVGLSAHSLGVLAAGADYLADAAAIAVALFAIWWSSRPGAGERGRSQATTYAAMINAGWLLALSVGVTIGAADRLIRGARRVDGLPVLVVSAVAAAVMLIGAFILGGDIDQHDVDQDRAVRDGGDLNVRAVLLDTVADAAAAGGVAAAGAVILIRRGLYWLDPLVAGVIAVVIAYHAAGLLREILAHRRRPPTSGAEPPRG